MYGDLDNDQLQTINEKQEQLRKLKELATKRAIFLFSLSGERILAMVKIRQS